MSQISQNPANSSFNEVEEKTPINSFVIVIAVVAAIAGILFGFDTGVISGAILFIKQEYALTAFMNGVVVSAALFGALCGSLVSGRFADIFGRRLLLIITALIFLVGTVASAKSISIPLLFFSRFIVGFAIGVASFTTPLYISEIAPPRIRGALVSLNQLMITVGILCSYGVDRYFSQTGEWRWMLGMGAVPAAILFVGMFFLPKSPRWVVLSGRIDMAKRILQKIRGSDAVENELKQIQDSLQEKSDWRLLTQKWLRPALIIGLGLGFFQQCTGINTIIYYAPTIFEMSGFHGASAAIMATAGVGVANVLFTVIALPLIDLWGRRPLLIFGLIGMMISLVIISLSFHFGAGYAILKWLAFGSMLLYIASFAMSLGPIMWLMIAEIFPLEVRGLGSSLAIAASWAFNLIIALTFLSLIKWIGQMGTFMLYAVLSLLGIVFVVRCVPETKGVSLEHIEANLRAGVSGRDLGARL